MRIPKFIRRLLSARTDPQRDAEGWITPPTEEPLWRGPINPETSIPVHDGFNGMSPYDAPLPIEVSVTPKSIPWDAPTTTTPIADLNRIAKEARERPGTLTMDEWIERQNRELRSGKRYRFDGPESR